MTDADLDAEHAAAVAAAPPSCLCSHPAVHHGRSNHAANSGKCWNAACGCLYYRPEEVEQ